MDSDKLDDIVATARIHHYKNRLKEFLILYREFTQTANINKPENKFDYVLYNIGSEVGELQGVHAKYIRDSGDPYEYEEKMRKELGDIMWHVSEVCNAFNWSIEEIMLSNMAKITDRFNRNSVRGSGDDR